MLHFLEYVSFTYQKRNKRNPHFPLWNNTFVQHPFCLHKPPTCANLSINNRLLKRQSPTRFVFFFSNNTMIYFLFFLIDRKTIFFSVILPRTRSPQKEKISEENKLGVAHIAKTFWLLFLVVYQSMQHGAADRKKIMFLYSNKKRKKQHESLLMILQWVTRKDWVDAKYHLRHHYHSSFHLFVNKHHQRSKMEAYGYKHGKHTRGTQSTVEECMLKGRIGKRDTVSLRSKKICPQKHINIIFYPWVIITFWNVILVSFDVCTMASYTCFLSYDSRIK